MPRSILRRILDFYRTRIGYGHKSMTDHGATVLAAKLRITAIVLGALLLVVAPVSRALAGSA